MSELFRFYLNGFLSGKVFFKNAARFIGQARFNKIIYDLRLDQSPTWPHGHVGDWSRDIYTNYLLIII